MEIDPALLAPAISQMENETGYRLNTGHLSFFGLCAECQPNSR
jgi:Fur family ferric uptake transcriptional regulator